jgi:hypothetical protein
MKNDSEPASYFSLQFNELLLEIRSKGLREKFGNTFACVQQLLDPVNL